MNVENKLFRRLTRRSYKTTVAVCDNALLIYSSGVRGLARDMLSMKLTRSEC